MKEFKVIENDGQHRIDIFADRDSQENQVWENKTNGIKHSYKY